MKRSGLLDALAYCETCGWETQARNAVGNAAQHAKRHPDHDVRAEQTILVRWSPT